MSSETGATVCTHGLASAVLPGQVVVVEGALDDEVLGLFPEEASHIAAAVEGRQREFATARRLAREALERLDVPPQPLVPTPDRAPVWPTGFVGSITHTRQYCAVAVGRGRDVLSIGIDIEEVDRVSEKLERLFALPGEIDVWMDEGLGRDRARALLFSAKEAFYKSQHPLTGRLLTFHDVRVKPDGAGGFSIAVVDPDDDDYGILTRCGTGGRMHLCCGLVVTALAPSRIGG